MSRPVALWAIPVAVIAFAVGAWFAYQSSVPAPDKVAAAALAGLALPDPDGKEQRLDQWRGKVVVVNFWATWCAPCREEMPEFMKAQTEFGAKGLQFVGVAVDQPDKVREFVQETKLNYPTLIGGFGAMELSKTLGNSLMALPFTVVLDRKGNVVHTQLGTLKPDKLASITRELL
jgi:peroxiredoxin